MEAYGWVPDPSVTHDARSFRQGRPTSAVLDESAQTSDEPSKELAQPPAPSYWSPPVPPGNGADLRARGPADGKPSPGPGCGGSPARVGPAETFIGISASKPRRRPRRRLVPGLTVLLVAAIAGSLLFGLSDGKSNNAAILGSANTTTLDPTPHVSKTLTMDTPSATVSGTGAGVNDLSPNPSPTPRPNSTQTSTPTSTRTSPPTSTRTSTPTSTLRQTPTSVTSPAPKPSPSSGFVTRNGTTLMLTGQPYRFTGINIYMAASGGTPSSCGGELYPDVSVPLSQLPRGTVVRMWAFQNFFVSDGAFNWTNLDQVLAIAASYGDKVIPVLANQYSYCDTAKNLAWYQSGYQNTVEPGDLVTYRAYVAAVVSRYTNNPTVATWQLVNEGEAVNSDGTCNESAALGALIAFSNDVGGLAHSLDPNHLVSLGVLAGWSGGGAGQWCGAANGDYQTLMASSGNDVCDYHDYGYPADPMGVPFAPDLTSAIQMCHADGKPLMVAETGIYADSSVGLVPRAAEFSAKFSAQFQAGVVGELMWAWTPKAIYTIPDDDADYGIFPSDPSLGVLGTF